MGVVYHIALDEYTPGGYTRPHMKPIVNRVKRLEGQLARVRQELEAGTSCETVVPQFLAVKGALDACLETYLLEALEACALRKSPEDMAMLLKTVIKKI